MPKEPVISVITATYNGANFIQACIESVAASILYPLDVAFEHIVFNDGSTDHTAKICQQYKHIRFYEKNENQGPAIALNQAISKAKGDYIFVLDHDDVILQRTLYNLYSTLHQTSQRWIYSDFIRGNQNLCYLTGQDYFGWKFNSPQEMLISIFEGQHFLQHNAMYEKKLWQEVGCYDEKIRIFLDLDLFIRFLLADEMPSYTPITSHIHRFHQNNLSHGQAGAQHLKNIQYLAKKYLWNSTTKTVSK